MSVQYRFNSFRLFAEPRLALHQGDLARAVAVVAARDDATCGQYHAYAVAIAAEVAVMTGADDAEAQLAAAAEMALENAYAAAYLLRAAGRLHGDEQELSAAVARWEVIGARFERACTLLLLPDRAAEGRAELAALRCTLPSA
jgi:hypothetical protein